MKYCIFAFHYFLLFLCVLDLFFDFWFVFFSVRYKILFLDVLFPLNIKKIIFVDADQIVRADLQELANLNLQGAPYGYTPFCSSRKEMDGFRFWKSGYWASHLAGRKYHIRFVNCFLLQTYRVLIPFVGKLFGHDMNSYSLWMRMCVIKSTYRSFNFFSRSKLQLFKI